MKVKMNVKMVLDTCIYALNNVVTYGKDSCENIVNTIKNLEALRCAWTEAEKESKTDDT